MARGEKIRAKRRLLAAGALALILAGLTLWKLSRDNDSGGSPTRPQPETAADPDDAILSPIGSGDTSSNPPGGDRDTGGSSEWIRRGSALLNEGRFDEAIQPLQEAARLMPDDEDAHYNLGIALARADRFEEAAQAYRKALQLFPDYVEAHNNLGNLLMRTGRLAEATEHFRAAIAVMPDYASAHNNLGTALRQQGETNAATGHFEQAVALDPNYWQARYNLGLSYVAQGRLQEGRAELEKVAESQPGFQPVRDALQWLEQADQAPPEW